LRVLSALSQDYLRTPIGLSQEFHGILWTVQGLSQDSCGIPWTLIGLSWDSCGIPQTLIGLSCFFIKKKDGKLHFVQDYCKLNAMTVKNRYPLLLILKLVEKLRSTK
jgi:hypothetical protein